MENAMQKFLIVATIIAVFTGCEGFTEEMAQKKKKREEKKQQLDAIEQSLEKAGKIIKDL